MSLSIITPNFHDYSFPPKGDNLPASRIYLITYIGITSPVKFLMLNIRIMLILRGAFAHNLSITFKFPHRKMHSHAFLLPLPNLQALSKLLLYCRSDEYRYDENSEYRYLIQLQPCNLYHLIYQKE